MRHVGCALVVGTCLIGLACGGAPAGADKSGATKVEAKPEVKAVPPDSKAPPAAEPKLTRRGNKDAPKGKAVQLEKAPETTRKAFWEAIQRGRKLTAKKDYDGAIAAFDEALVQLPNHPRALSGKGYAELLADKLDAAEADLRKALAAPGTKKLESAIAFNLGLLAEKRGDAELAKAQFSLANTLNPSKAAQDKLAGGTACPVTVEYAKPESKLYLNWMETWQGLVELGVIDGADKPADEAAAEKLVCLSEPLDNQGGAPFDMCKKDPGGPWVSRRYFDYGAEALIVIEPADGSQIRVTDLGWVGGGRCGADTEITVVRGDVTLVTWRVNEYAPIEVMENDKGEMVDCEGDNICFSACGEEVDASFATYAFSPWTPDPTGVHGPVAADGRSPLATVKAEGRELVLSGGGCDKRVPLVNPKQ